MNVLLILISPIFLVLDVKSVNMANMKSIENQYVLGPFSYASEWRAPLKVDKNTEDEHLSHRITNFFMNIHCITYDSDELDPIKTPQNI